MRPFKKDMVVSQDMDALKLKLKKKESVETNWTKKKNKERRTRTRKVCLGGDWGRNGEDLNKM